MAVRRNSGAPKTETQSTISQVSLSFVSAVGRPGISAAPMSRSRGSSTIIKAHTSSGCGRVSLKLSSILGGLKVNPWDYKGSLIPQKRLKATYSTTKYRLSPRVLRGICRLQGSLPLRMLQDLVLHGLQRPGCYAMSERIALPTAH